MALSEKQLDGLADAIRTGGARTYMWRGYALAAEAWFRTQGWTAPRQYDLIEYAADAPRGREAMYRHGGHAAWLRVTGDNIPLVATAAQIEKGEV